MENIMPYLGIGVVWLIIIAISLFCLAWAWLFTRTIATRSITSIAVVIGLIVAAFFSHAYLSSASFERTKKAAVTEYNASKVEREVKVISENGQGLYQTSGHFDIEYKDNRLRWIDEDGKVQLVYIGNSSTVIINEK